MTTDKIKLEVENLRAYFPGRQKLALLWLIIFPIVFFVIFQVKLDNGQGFSLDGGLLYYFSYMAGSSINMAYSLASVVTLLRICYSPRMLWEQSATITMSALIYSLIVTMPGFLFAFFLTVVCLGTSLCAVVQVLVGLVLLLGSLLVLLAILASVAHRSGLMIPFLLVLIPTYQYLLPILYTADTVPAQRWMLLTFGVPLSPVITILRHGLLNQGFAPASYWAGAIVHAMAGYGLAFWMWKRRSPNQVPEDTAGALADPQH